VTAHRHTFLANRRTVLVGAGALLLAGGVAEAAEPGLYDYLFLELKPGQDTRAKFVAHLKTMIPQIKKEGGELLGMFNPQLGWSSQQVAVIVRWPNEDVVLRDILLRHLAPNTFVSGGKVDVLKPTLRPAMTDEFKPGGIYVHRWFELAAADMDAFVELSKQGWPDFETRFDSKVFGLFTAQQRPDEKMAGTLKMLLITRYGGHGVWEESRDPSTAAMGLFAKRRLLTRTTTAASTLYAPIV